MSSAGEYCLSFLKSWFFSSMLSKFKALQNSLQNTVLHHTTVDYISSMCQSRSRSGKTLSVESRPVLHINAGFVLQFRSRMILVYICLEIIFIQTSGLVIAAGLLYMFWLIKN